MDTSCGLAFCLESMPSEAGAGWGFNSMAESWKVKEVMEPVHWTMTELCDLLLVETKRGPRILEVRKPQPGIMQHAVLGEELVCLDQQSIHQNLFKGVLAFG